MMASCSKWHERSSKVKYREGRDRINSLPDNVLSHILSFLSTKYAVGTSVLSHRWRYLFTFATNLDFDDSLSFHPLSSHPRSHLGLALSCQNRSSPFKDFVDRVLMLHRSSQINRFCLRISRGFDCSNVNAWLQVALLRRVTMITISTKESAPTLLPCSLFTCETLMVLKLHGNFKMKIPTSLRLPHLKFLHLSSVKFTDECSLNRFISGCCLLEDMVIKAKWRNMENINISLPRLRNLTMDFGEGLSDFFHRANIVLDLPNLRGFHYVDFLASNYSIKNLESLEEAYINVSLDLEDGDSDTFRGSALHLLKGVSSANNLSLTGNGMEALNWVEPQLPVFCNLSDLELGWSNYVNWKLILPKFLHSSPVLEHLAFSEGLQHCESNDAYDKNFWSRQRKWPSCLSSHLKTITILHFHGYEEEASIARYFLRHGKVLRELMLDSRVSSREECQRLRKLCRVRKASKDCSIELLDESEVWSWFF